jgi:hypothetical protein
MRRFFLAVAFFFWPHLGVAQQAPNATKVAPAAVPRASVMGALYVPGLATGSIGSWRSKTVGDTLPRSFAHQEFNGRKRVEAEAEAGRPSWVLPVIGAAVGAGAGWLWANDMVDDAGDWIAPPPHVLLVPVGALAGAIVGAVANSVFK